MNKVNRKISPKFLVLLAISLFIVSYVPELASTSLAASPRDNWVGRPMHISTLVDPFALSGYSPSQIRGAYGLPSSGGVGATIAIIDSFDSSNIRNDLAVFSTRFDLPAPSNSNFEVHPMSANMDTNSSWTEETCLDVEWAHAIAPDAKILLVEAQSDDSTDLLAAINYTRYRSDVVAVSMSWGTPEYSQEVIDDLTFLSSNSMQFFAASGDNGTIMWPASSPLVVAVGGTSLNLNSDGSVNSEIAWSGSGGGVSRYERISSEQKNYGLTGTKRCVPDVSYDADTSTGFLAYCNSQWYKMGGTSAGTPQWAAMYALGRSATNAYLYAKAKTFYSSYFRDITSGSNGAYNATTGYDFVTGLGSPLTYNFAFGLTVSPNSGPPQGAITLNGDGLTPSSSANISWLNPLTSTWVLMANNVTADSLGHFTYSSSAPDLLQDNPAGDNQPNLNNIIFRAKDNSNGNLCNTTIPYTEWRRGLTQIDSQAATGLYGNRTNFATKAFVQNGQLITMSGKWFVPGAATFFWDSTVNLGTAAIDETGAFSANVTVPASTLGQHTVTINDGASNFCVNVTRSPIIANDYVYSWHTSDILVNLTPECNVTETYYSINNGPVCNASAYGQPTITTEGANNTLEYWCTWNSYGTGNMELPHITLTDIQLQKTSPQGLMQINNGASSTNINTVTLTVSATSLSGVCQMRFSNDGIWDTESWETFSTPRAWMLTNGDGVKTVYCQVRDNAGLTTSFASSLSLTVLQATSTPTPSYSSPPLSTPSSSPSATPSPSKSSSPAPSPTPEAPESSIQMVLILLALVTFSFMIKQKSKTQNQN
jgi:hypothetical protein